MTMTSLLPQQKNKKCSSECVLHFSSFRLKTYRVMGQLSYRCQCFSVEISSNTCRSRTFQMVSFLLCKVEIWPVARRSYFSATQFRCWPDCSADCWPLTMHSMRFVVVAFVALGETERFGVGVVDAAVVVVVGDADLDERLWYLMWVMAMDKVVSVGSVRVSIGD